MVCNKTRAASRLSFTTADAAVCNAVWHYLTLHQHDKTRTELLNDVAGALALDDKLGRSTNQLSGGEWQRVRLAAVVLQITPQANPAGQLLLLDEPMNSLDVAQQNALDKILSALCQQGLAIVMSSHDLNHTLRHAHRAWLLKGGKMLASGRRRECSRRQIWHRPMG